MEEAPAPQQEPAAQEAESVPSPPPAAARSMTESLPSALEPELRRIIDAAVARVAAIELEAIRDARELTQRSEQEARESLKFALDRAFNLIATLELMAATVSGMAEALKIELDDAIEALRKVPEPRSALARELAPAAPEAQAAPEPAVAQPEAKAPEAKAPEAKAPEATEPEAKEPEPAQPEPAPEPPKPEPAPVAAQPEPELKPEAAQPEPVLEPEAEAPTTEEPAAEPHRNGHSPAERQAQSLAAAAARERDAQQAPEPEPERTMVTVGPSDGDGRPAVPVRRKGLMRRLFTK